MQIHNKHNLNIIKLKSSDKKFNNIIPMSTLFSFLFLVPLEKQVEFISFLSKYIKNELTLDEVISISNAHLEAISCIRETKEMQWCHCDDHLSPHDIIQF